MRLYIINRYLLIAILLPLFFNLKSRAQTVYNNCVDGAIYVKIFDHESETLPLLNNGNNSNSNSNLGVFQEAVDGFEITKIYKSFDFFTLDASLQKVYRVEFNKIWGVDKLMAFFEHFDYIEVAEKISLNIPSCTTDPIYQGTNTNDPNRYHYDAINACGGSNNFNISPVTPISVGIVDNECDISHPDFSFGGPSAISASYDVADQDPIVLSGNVYESHGTAVTGAILARRNSVGTVALGTHAFGIFAKAASDANQNYITHGYEGIAYCIQNGADIINCSWGSTFSPGIVEQLVLDMAENRNIVVVAAAGNTGLQSSLNQPAVYTIGTRVYPAAYRNVLSVTATKRATGASASSSGNVISGLANHNIPGSPAGDWIDVSAPGESVYSTVSTLVPGSNGYGTFYGSGTSISCAIVSGLCARMIDFNNSATAQQIRNCIINTAINVDADNSSLTAGSVPPRVDVLAAATCISAGNNLVDWTTTTPSGGCVGTSLNFTDLSVVLNGPINHWGWSFAGGTPGVSSQQNPANIVYNTPGNYDVTLTVTDAGNVQHARVFPRAISILGLDAQMVNIDQPIGSSLSTYCDGSEVQVRLTPLGGYPPYTITYQVPGSPPQTKTFNKAWSSVFFQASSNGIDLLAIEATDYNGAPIVCSLNNHINTPVIPCCENQIVNGKFELGNTNFSSILCHNPNSYGYGYYTVSDIVLPTINNSSWPSFFSFLPEKNNSLCIQSSASNSAWFAPPYVPSPLCSQAQIALCTDLSGTVKRTVWEQTVSLDATSEYRFSFLMSSNFDLIGIPNSQTFHLPAHPNLNFEIYDNTNTNLLFQGDVVTHTGGNATNLNQWLQYYGGIPSGVLPSSGQFIVKIQQSVQFCDIRYLVDDVVLQKEGQDFTITASDGCVAPSGSVTITALPASLNYTFSGTGITPTSGNTATVNQSGTFTVTATSPNVCNPTKEIFIGDCANCPQAPTSATWYGSPTVSTDIPNGSLPQGDIVIDGTLTVDQSLAITNIQNGHSVYFTPNAVVNLQANTTLNIDQSELRGCSSMWDGITALNNASEVKMANSKIRDMENGIRIEGSSNLTAQKTDFENNNVSISLSNLPATTTTIIDDNNFFTSGNLLPPFQTQSYGKHGVKLLECIDYTLLPNHFETLKNGIYVNQQDNATGPSTITTSGSTFKDIKGDYYQSGGGFFGWNPEGTGVFFLNQTVHDSKLIHFGNNNSATLDFDDCTRGIMTNNVSTDIQNNYMNDADFGAMIYQPENHVSKVLFNHIDNTMLGVLVSGNASGGGVTGNHITMKEAATAVPGVHYPTSPRTAKGIVLSFYNNMSSSAMAVFNNTLSTTNDERTTAIEMNNSPWSPCKNNTISFNATTASTNTYPLPHLIGFKPTNCLHGEFEENTVKSLHDNNPNVLLRKPLIPTNKTVGIYTHKSLRAQYICNKIDFTQYGMYVVGDNRGNYTSLGNNRFAASKSGILYRHLVDDGTLGNIGIDQSFPTTLKWDGNNKFPLLTGGIASHKVRRVTVSCASFANNPLDEINTDGSNLTSNDVSSIDALLNTGTCKVQVSNPSFALNEKADCGVTAVPNNIMSPDDEIIDHAEDVAEDGVVYTQYPEGGEMMDERELYAMLDADPSLRNGRPILDSFYLAHQQDVMAQLHEVDMLIAEITAINVDKTSAFYINTLATAKTLNSQIVSNEVFETNERAMNTIYLNMLTEGWYGYTQAEVNSVIQLAADCPYLGGFGVYKARTLAMEFLPNAHYDDLWICNNMGVYKNGNTRFNKENEILQGSSENTITDKVSNEYELYPNPTQGTVQIRYTGSEEADKMTFTLYDLIGNKILVKEGLINYSYISIPPTANGIYTYTITNGSKIVKRDKLLIER